MRRLISLLMVTCCFGAVSASAAQAEIVQFMNHTFLETGQNHFSENFGVRLSWVWGHSAGKAASCVGASGHPEFQVCGPEGEEVQVITEFMGFAATGYLHNHSAYNSYFYAWAQGER